MARQYELPRAQGRRHPRFIVGMPGQRVLYEGDSEMRAWLAWFWHRQQSALAYEPRSWIIDRKPWLIADMPPVGMLNSSASI